MILVVTEKPSVSQALAKVLGADKRRDGYLEGNGYRISWCLGHLLEYAEPDAYDEKYKRWDYADLPIIPEQWKLFVASQKEEQFQVLSGLLKRDDSSCVVNACDAGREGESIFRRVYQYAGSSLPIKRLWISSMEDQAIREGFENLKDGSAYENLYQAAECRAKADWLVGMNATRAYTTKYYKRLVIGRVQTPTLAMLAERQGKIDGFEKEAFYKVSLAGGGLVVVSPSIKYEKEAAELERECQGKALSVTAVNRTKKKTAPPKLYDLTGLQREANRYYGYTAKETLDVLQELYESKLVTYPRTDSQYITEDMVGTVAEILEVLPSVVSFLAGMEMGQDIARLVNPAKVTDHHALLPTKEIAGSSLDGLGEKHRNLLYLISQRLAQAVSTPCLYEEAEVEASCSGHPFQIKGKAVLEPGFTAVEAVFKGTLKDAGRKKEDAEKEPIIPEGLKEGAVIPDVAAEMSRHFTAPPKPYTEDTLLSAMEAAGREEFDRDTEKKGLGTPATRAGIIEKLVSSGYAARKGKQILPTKEGMELIRVLPATLCSAGLTAEWENRLLSVERGEAQADDFLEGIVNLVYGVLHECDSITQEEQKRFDQRVKIGNCPMCGKAVYESKTNFYCEDKSCRFALWKENRYLQGMRKVLDRKMAEELLESGRTHVKGLYSAKKDALFEADLMMKTEDGRPVFSLSFPDKRKGNPGERKKSKQKK